MNRFDEINKIVNNLNNSVNLMTAANDGITKNTILNYMRCQINDLYIINNLDRNLNLEMNPAAETMPMQNERTFTRRELAGYNGKNGAPAYVAVNGTVYDVTNNAAWGAATHFGLSAGNDLTAQFSSCHAGQPILQKLPVVGKMIE